MEQYIVNLTNHLIKKNRYDGIFRRIDNLEKFIEYVQIDLETGDVRAMSPAKLGQIMCAFQIGDGLVSKHNFINGVQFKGDCEEMLRELVSLCLACVIGDRISRHSSGDSLYDDLPVGHVLNLEKFAAITEEARIRKLGSRRALDELDARR